MRVYKVEITETFQKVVEVEADNINEALLKTKENYDNASENYILDYADLTDTVFNCI